MPGHRAIIVIGLGLFLCCAPLDARATPYTITPNGDLLVDLAFTTHGVFTCQQPAPICSGSGNSVILSFGTGSATVTFSGVTTALEVGAISQHVVLGEIHTFVSGGFTFPPGGGGPNILRFDLSLAQTLPVPSSGATFWWYGPSGDHRFGASVMSTQIGPQPPGFHYSVIEFDFDPWPVPLPGNGDILLGADVGLMPEPATILSFGTSAAGVTLARWFRRKRAHAA